LFSLYSRCTVSIFGYLPVKQHHSYLKEKQVADIEKKIKKELQKIDRQKIEN